MKSLKHWIIALALDGSLVTLLYQWQFRQVEGAGNIFMFVTWFLAVLGIIAALVPDKKAHPRRPVFRAYKFVAHTCIIGALAWTGHYVAATTYVVAFILMHASSTPQAKQDAAREAA
jgi:predicted membrane channel-forming protein YqfA (hemolysin III family)